MRRPEPPVGDAAQRRQPDVLDNQGQPVPVSPALALDASQRVVQGKVCYGVMLFSNTHALSGRDPVRLARQAGATSTVADCLASSTTHADLSWRHRATSRSRPHAKQRSLQLGACRRAVQVQLHWQVDARGAATRQGWRQGGAALLRRPRNTSSVITGRRRCAHTRRRARRCACWAAAATAGGAWAAHLPSRDTGPDRLLRALEEERQQDCAAHAGQRECNALAADRQQPKGGMTPRPTDAHGCICCEFLHSFGDSTSAGGESRGGLT